MHIAILTFDGFNELDSFIALGILNRVRRRGWRVSIACQKNHVTSKNGVMVAAQASLAESRHADAVIIGSGRGANELSRNQVLMRTLSLDPRRQLIGAQCSGALILAKLGLLKNTPACTDARSRAAVQAAGIEVLDQPFFARNNVATAGGCLASPYLAGWIVACSVGLKAAAEALRYFAPVGETAQYVDRAIDHIRPFVRESSSRYVH